MIVKFLSKSKSFRGVTYNTDKTEQNKGELLEVHNFDALKGIEDLRPQDYITYLKAISARNKRIRFPQLHVVISCKGKEQNKEELARIAGEWMNGMGYGDQPYLLVFHKDTANNHLHVVSTRVGRDGKKIDDSFERVRAYQVLNRIMGQDESRQAASDVEKALTYHFSTRAQFMMLLEGWGYHVRLSGTQYQVSKFGKELANVSIRKVDARILEYRKNPERIQQLRAIIRKYREIHNPAIYERKEILAGSREGKTVQYTSELSEALHRKFGLQAIFHAASNKPPYGYTLIDRAGKTVYKGGDILSLSQFTKGVDEQPAISPLSFPAKTTSIPSERDHAEHELFPESLGKELELSEKATIEAEDDLPYDTSVEGLSQPLPALMPGVDISDDIDDEAILGRNRRRKRKARTNTR